MGDQKGVSEMQRLWVETLFLVVIIGTVGCVQKVLSAEQNQSNDGLQSSEDLFSSKLAN